MTSDDADRQLEDGIQSLQEQALGSDPGKQGGGVSSEKQVVTQQSRKSQ